MGGACALDHDANCKESHHDLISLIEHDLFGKPVSTFLYHALRLKIIYLEGVVWRVVRSTGCRRSSQSTGVITMQYLLMIYRNEAELSRMSPADRQKMSAEYGVFTQSIVQSGHFKAGDGLQPTTTATTVRVRDGKTLTTDGPFAETREQLGGYYLIEAKDLDTALGIAARIPGARDGSIEVRPIMIYK